MRVFLSLVTAITIAGTALAADSSEPPISNPTGLVDNLTPELVSSLVTELGAKSVEIKSADQGGKLVTFMDGNIPYNMGITVCDVRPGKCLGLLMLVFMDMGERNITTDMINARNKDNFFDTAMKIDDKVIAFGRGVLVDGGVTRKNLAMNIGVYAALVLDGLKHFTSQIVASAPFPGSYQRVSYNRGPLRLVRPTPQQMNAAMIAFSAKYKEALNARRAH